MQAGIYTKRQTLATVAQHQRERTVSGATEVATRSGGDSSSDKLKHSITVRTGGECGSDESSDIRYTAKAKYISNCIS